MKKHISILVIFNPFYFQWFMFLLPCISEVLSWFFFQFNWLFFLICYHLFWIDIFVYSYIFEICSISRNNILYINNYVGLWVTTRQFFLYFLTCRNLLSNIINLKRRYYYLLFFSTRKSSALLNEFHHFNDICTH